MQVEVEVIAFHAFIYSVPFYRNSPPMEIIAPRDSCYYVLILSPTLPHSSSWYMLRSAMCCHIRVFVTSWTVACKLPLSVGFSRQEHWSGLPFPTLGDLPVSGIEPTAPVFAALQADSLSTEPSVKPTWGGRKYPFAYVFLVCLPLLDCTVSNNGAMFCGCSLF